MQLYNISINNLRRRKAKLLFVLLGLVIGIATIVAVYGVVEAMKTEMTKQVAEFGVNVVITPNTGGLTFSYGGITLPEIMYDVEELSTDDLSAIEDLPSRNMIRALAPKLLGLGTLENHQKVFIVGGNLYEEFLVKPWLVIEGQDQLEMKSVVNKESEEKSMSFDIIDLTRQDLIELNISEEQILIGSALSKSLGLKKGDKLKISDKELQIYGILMETGAVEDQQVFMHLNTAQELLNRPEEITIIEMAVDYSLGSEEGLLAEIANRLPNVNVTSLRQETLRRDEMLTRVVRFGVTISVLVLLVGMLVVALTMAGSVRERTREIGVFRALGFRKSHITQLILFEGGLISIFGGIIGYVVGILIAQYGGPLFTGMEIVVPWSFGLLLGIIAISTAIGLLSSLYPAYMASKLDPVEALRFI